jgi:penicillin amidase
MGMIGSLARAAAVGAVLVVTFGCRQNGAATGAPDETRPGASEEAQTSGTLAVGGLSAPVRVIRDRWGIPHITAANQDDLFFAQGFVQAQDRLFQMDLWRRAVQGRLSEVLGPNFIERDAMTRRVQYRGDSDSEWASYGPGTKAIATAFTRGINARIRLIGQRLPEEFVLAGWAPELWRPADLLNRTDAFVASADAQDEVFRAELVAAVGAARASALLPPRGAILPPPGLDVGAVSPIVADNLRRAGTAPFFMGFAAPFQVRRGPPDVSDRRSFGDVASPGEILALRSNGSNAWAVARGENGAPLVAVDPHVAMDTPSLRYLVHLQAPGWNVIGATSPWLPGVAIGHNDRVAWGMTAFAADTEDVYVERVNPSNARQIADRGRWIDMTVEKEAIVTKGREPYVYDRLYTPHGVVVALDPERHLAFAVRWAGFEPGTAPELAALALDRAGSSGEFRAALARWRMPAAEFVFAGVDGQVGRQVAALVPGRAGWGGALPVPGDAGAFEWRGWAALDDLPRASTPASGFVMSANGSAARLNRIGATLQGPGARSLEGFKRLQQDVLAWNGGQLIPLLSHLHAERADVEEARQRLLGWDGKLTVTSTEAALYVAWERRLLGGLAALRVPRVLVDRYVAQAASVLVPAILHPSGQWFDAGFRGRDVLLLTSLADAVDEVSDKVPAGDREWGARHRVTFAHPLGITTLARERFSVGPIAAPGYAETVASIPLASRDRSIGPSFRAVMDAGNWDRSVAVNAPGQSGNPGSRHYRDQVNAWSTGEYVPLAFSDEAVQRSVEATLTLTPR